MLTTSQEPNCPVIDSAQLEAKRWSDAPDNNRLAKERYLPEPEHKRQGVSLCLSGGGFRAALFHLGAARRLNELGLLTQIDEFSSVSGGSIFASWLAQCALEKPWPVAGEIIPNWEEDVAVPFRRFTSTSMEVPKIALRRLLPWNWFGSNVDTKALAQCYHKLNKHKLTDLPERPNFMFCATDLAFGVNWIFGRAVSGDYQAGYLPTPRSWPVAMAVAASSCFPVVFAPMWIRFKPSDLRGGLARKDPCRDELIQGLRLCDGGVYDNMGLEPVWKYSQIVLVSDGGAPFGFTGDTSFFARLGRYYVVQSNQARTLRRRWLISQFLQETMHGGFWGINGYTKKYNVSGVYAGYSEDLVRQYISQIRTDLNAFSEAEIAVLENHGYMLAEAAVQEHVAQHLTPRQAAFAVPHPDWLDEKKVANMLKASIK